RWKMRFLSSFNNRLSQHHENHETNDSKYDMKFIIFPKMIQLLLRLATFTVSVTLLLQLCNLFFIVFRLNEFVRLVHLLQLLFCFWIRKSPIAAAEFEE